jgi:hypothetical protein
MFTLSGFGKVELFLLRRAILVNTPDREHAVIEDVRTMHPINRVCILPTDAG